MIIVNEHTEEKIVIGSGISEETIDVRAHAHAAVSVDARNTLNLIIRLTGEKASVDVRGAFLGKGDDLQRITFAVHEEAPRTSVRVMFRAALEDSSSSLFTGLIRMSPEAEEASGLLSYKALLLSDRARAVPEPRLEILTKRAASCRHEASVSNLNERDLFYLRSRGMLKEEAQKLMVEGFLKEAFFV